MQQFQSGHGDPAGDPLTSGEFGLITRDLARSTGAGQVLLAVRDETDGTADLVSAWSHNGNEPRLTRPPSATDLVGRVLESGQSALEPINESGLTYGVGAPINDAGTTMGALCAAFSSVPPDKAHTLWVVESYARMAALCLHDPGTLEGLLSAARRDALTGCLSYGALRHELHREIGRAARYGRAVSCCFIDLDHFKQVNERYGHLHGSRVLAEVAAALETGMREGDRLGRFGGDEFVVVLPDTEEASAHVLGQRLRQRIVDISETGSSSSIDASIGVAQWNPGSSGEELLAAADDALREAKAAGGAVVMRSSDLHRATDAGQPARKTA